MTLHCKCCQDKLNVLDSMFDQEYCFDCRNRLLRGMQSFWNLSPDDRERLREINQQKLVIRKMY